MTTEMSSTEDIIGRAEIDDFEAILSVVGTEEADGRHVCLLYTSPSPRD